MKTKIETAAAMIAATTRPSLELSTSDVGTEAKPSVISPPPLEPSRPPERFPNLARHVPCFGGIRRFAEEATKLPSTVSHGA